MTQINDEKLGMSAYTAGKFHAHLTMMRNDLHMGDTKAALIKVNDLIKLIDAQQAVNETDKDNNDGEQKND